MCSTKTVAKYNIMLTSLLDTKKTAMVKATSSKVLAVVNKASWSSIPALHAWIINNELNSSFYSHNLALKEKTYKL